MLFPECKEMLRAEKIGYTYIFPLDRHALIVIVQKQYVVIFRIVLVRYSSIFRIVLYVRTNKRYVRY